MPVKRSRSEIETSFSFRSDCRSMRLQRYLSIPISMSAIYVPLLDFLLQENVPHDERSRRPALITISKNVYLILDFILEVNENNTNSCDCTVRVFLDTT